MEEASQKLQLEESTWVDQLIPPSPDSDPLLHQIATQQFTDRADQFQLGALDQSIAAVLFNTLRVPTPRTLQFQLPRGTNEVSTLIGILAQLARLYEERQQQVLFEGSVIVVGMDTLVERRLSEVYVNRLALAEGLNAWRIRSDGRVARRSKTEAFDPSSNRLLYLNTRVGWPKLEGETEGVIIVDRTTLSNTDTYERALAWAQGHDPRLLIIVSSIGDQQANALLNEEHESPLVWSASDELIDELSYILGTEPASTPLSTNELLTQVDAGPSSSRIQQTHINAADYDSAFRQAYYRLSSAYETDSALPYPIVLCQRLLYGIKLLVGTTTSFDKEAALDYRSVSFNSLSQRIENYDASALPPEWRRYGATHWAALRSEVLGLLEAVNQYNPKFWALLVTLRYLLNDSQEGKVVVRAANSAAATALESDLGEYWDMVAPNVGSLSDHIQCEPLSSKLHWGASRAEILPGVPPRSHRSLLWSDESHHRIVLCYPWESALLSRTVREHAERLSQHTSNAFLSLDLGPAPPINSSSVPTLHNIDETAADVSPAVSDLDVGLDALTSNLETLQKALDDTEGETHRSPYSTGEETEAIPVVLEPGDQCWWCRPEAKVEILMGDKYVRLAVQELRAGDRVLIPKGSGREDLFARLVDARHRSGNAQDLLILIDRWHQTCRGLLGRCQERGIAPKRVLKNAGCTTTTRLEAWARGETIAPEDEKDIQRVAVLAGDDWLAKNWQRVAYAAKELRGLHRSIGHRISGAIREASSGGGPNLRALADILNVDPTEILDEFEVRIVHEVGDPALVDSYKVDDVIPVDL
jgi:hypothetical protein